MEHDLVLEGRVVTPEGLLDTEVGVADGKVAEIGHGLRGSKKIKAERCLIFPGFVDIHVHLREPGWERKEDFRTGTLAAAHGGVTTVADMPNNPTPVLSASALQAKKRLAREKAVVDVKLFGGVSRDNLSDLGRMAGDAVAFKIYLSETTGSQAFPPSELDHAFSSIAKTDKPVSLHCESQQVLDMSRGEKGIDAPDSYADLRPPAAETDAAREVVSSLSRTPGLRANVCHASTGETVNILRRARDGGMSIRCEATLHHLFFNRRALLENRLLRTNPPLRSEEDRQALLSGLRDGGVSFLVTDHAPHLEAEKLEKGLAGVPGLDDFSHVVSWLIREQGVDPALIARAASSNPARFLDLGDRGEVAVGKKADFTVLDVHSPEKVTSDRVMSKCGWSPYDGKVFPGRARWTISSGSLLVDDFELAV